MRPGQNRRIRGRARNKGPNPLTRSFESNGPDVKIRGTSQHIADKYSQLARDAQASGDPVAAENYFQHAEHYYRLIAAAQEQYRQQFPASQRDDEGDEGDEEAGFGGQSDRNQGGDDFGDGPPNFPQGGYDQRDRQGGYDQQQRYGGGYEQQRDRQGGRFDRNDRQNQNRQRFDRNGERYDRNQQGGERNQERGDRQGGEQRFDRQNGYERPNGYERQDRPDRQERPDRQDRRDRPDRPPREERGNRDGYAPREGRPEREPRRDARPVGYGADEQGDDAQETGGNLPAFLTTPVRAPASVEDVAESTGLAPSGPGPDEPEATGIRPRKRRTRKADPAPEGVDETADGA